jgi:hypothetical protein
MKQWAKDANQPWTNLKVNQFGFEKRLLAEAEKSVSYDESLKRMGTRDENGIVFPIDPLWENIGPD